MDTMREYPGVPGLFVACVFSASLSTLSSGFNALSTVTWDDFMSGTRLAAMPDWKIKVTLKLIGIFYGVLSIGMAFLVGKIGSVLEAAISLAGALFGPLFGLYLLGIMAPFANAIVRTIIHRFQCPNELLQGVIAGLLVGQSITIWITVGSLLYPKPLGTYETTIDNCFGRNMYVSSNNGNSSFSNEIVSSYTDGGVIDLYHTAFLLVPVTGFVISLVVGSIVSLLTMGHKKMHKVPSNYMSPMVYFFYPHSWLSQRRRPSDFGQKSMEFPNTFVVLEKIENDPVMNGHTKI